MRGSRGDPFGIYSLIGESVPGGGGGVILLFVITGWRDYRGITFGFRLNLYST